MASRTWQKNEHRQWISSYFGRYSQTQPTEELRDLVMWLAWKLSGLMTLAQLEEWRGRVGERGGDGNRCTGCGTTDHHVDGDGNIVENPARGRGG